ncbi:hypothetical protein AGOR_G00227150 [Albula goreensis]|uniref:Interleukin-2 receptor subunit beta N-terminal domain-containing protein n=1 Tax=Albula goreensis TaxID=1534307 RepID=A0A8T3CHE2_9TELE|nr:hypothetical protein AGOR_G00227150 [Albula goreensis]
METAWPVSLLLFLMHPVPGHSLKELTCFNDLFRNISCDWNSRGMYPKELCVLTATLERHKSYIKSCDLKPKDPHDRNIMSCDLEFNEVAFNFDDKLPIDVKCGNSNVSSMLYEVTENVKMSPPDQPKIHNYNISWHYVTSSLEILSYDFELQFKLAEQPWKDAEPRVRIKDQRKSVQLNKDQLEKGRFYQARVRVMSLDEELQNVWSNWSPVASWKSEVGRPPATGTISFKPDSTPGQNSELLMVVGLVAFASLLLLITCRYSKTDWVYKLKLPHVPNPSKYFDALNSVHGGNFQKWVGPLFAPESFSVTQSFDDISPVEVFKTNDITSHLSKEYPSEPAETWDSSSSYPGSYNVEVCSMYFSYKSGKGNPKEEGDGEGSELEDIPLKSSSSYKPLGDLQRESQQPDPDCGKGNDDQETREEKVEGLKERVSLPPPAILPFSLTSQIPPCLVPIFPHLPSFPQLPFHVFDSTTVPGGSDPLGPLEGAPSRPSFAEIEPSSGGYMSVQSARCNNSV